MTGLKGSIITWTLTLTFPVVVLLGVYFFFSNRLDRDDIGVVRQGVTTNARDIQNHKVRLDTNAKAIAANAERIDDCEEGIAENGERIDGVEKGVRENEKAVGKLGETSAAGRQAIEKRLAGLQDEVRRLKEARSEEESFRKDALKRMEELQKEIAELNRRLLEGQDRLAARLKALEEKAKGNPE